MLRGCCNLTQQGDEYHTVIHSFPLPSGIEERIDKNKVELMHWEKTTKIKEKDNYDTHIHKYIYTYMSAYNK